jgi:hypothetical protein
MEKIIELNLGIGINQLFPETTKIIIEVDEDQELKNVEDINEQNN